MAEEPSRITVSRDALRAELAEMELRLRVYFDERLNHKADTSAFAELALKFDRLDRGEFTDVHERALRDRFDAWTGNDSERAWARWQKASVLLSAVISISAFALTLLVTVKAGQL